MDKKPIQSSLYPKHPNVPQCPQPEAHPIKDIDRTACSGGIFLPSPRESGDALGVEGGRFISPIFLFCRMPGSSRNLPGGSRAWLFLSIGMGFISKVFSPGSHWEDKTPPLQQTRNLWPKTPCPTEPPGTARRMGMSWPRCEPGTRRAAPWIPYRDGVFPAHTSPCTHPHSPASPLPATLSPDVSFKGEWQSFV